MTVYEILRAKAIISAVPYKVKAEAVYHAFKSEFSPLYPATYLRMHKDWHLFMDKDSSSLI
jgi:glucosamine-6-phosphate deaminase